MAESELERLLASGAPADRAPRGSRSRAGGTLSACHALRRRGAGQLGAGGRATPKLGPARDRRRRGQRRGHRALFFDLAAHQPTGLRARVRDARSRYRRLATAL